MIDRIRHDIQRRLDQLHAEADKLRHALAPLDPRERSPPKPNLTSSRPSAKRSATTPAAAKPAPAPAASTANRTAMSALTTPGQTKAKVIAALSTGEGLTAGEVATATGLARPTVSTTLSRLSKTGEVVKAERGTDYPAPMAGARVLLNRQQIRNADA